MGARGISTMLLLLIADTPQLLRSPQTLGRHDVEHGWTSATQ
jgi:hypothetical protein